MVDNLEAGSAASSEIGESLREQILGKRYVRQRRSLNRTHNTSQIKPSQPERSLDEASYEIISNKESSLEILDYPMSGGDNNSLNSDKLAGSFVVVPRQQHSMKSVGDKRYVTTETQTVAVQTAETGVDVDLDCKCCWEEYDCICQNCECRCRNFPNRKRSTPEDTDFSNAENYTQSSGHSVEIRRRNNNYCKCSCNCENGARWSDESSYTDSEDSHSTDFFDLPYQNNQEYLKLLRELEKKLLARNKDRVKRTMLEFEKKSRQNQNLEKPIYDYSDDNASLLKKLSTKTRHPRRNKHSVCCKCGRNKRVNSDILQNENSWDEMNSVQSVNERGGDAKGSPLPHRIERSLHKSHWQLDPRSGEWIKVSCFQQTDFSRHGDHKKSVPPTDYACKEECKCRSKSRR